MKKLLACLLSVLFVLGMTGVTAFAADAPTISAGSEICDSDETVTVQLLLSNNPGIVAARISVQYDTSALTLTSVQNGNVFPANLATFGNDYTLSPYTMLWLDALATTNNTNSGVLATLTFKTADTANGDYPITVTYDAGSTFDMNLKPVSFTTQNGNIKVRGNAPVLVEKISLLDGDKDSFTMDYGASKKLEAKVTPADAENAKIVWTSSNPKVLSVDQNGKLTTHKKGVAEITAMTEDGTVSASCKVTVRYTFIQSLIVYVFFGFIWYLK